MKNSVKNFYLSSLNESTDNFYYLSEDVISELKDVSYDKKEDYIKIDFKTSYGKELTFLCNISTFKNWLKDHAKSENTFLSFLKDFIKGAKEEKEPEKLDEIIDDEGNIMPDDEMPNNSTGRMVGDKHRMDLEKIFLRSMPKSVRNYSGNLGLGTVVW